MIFSYAVWGAVTCAQNFGNTFVSRARNSASLKRHLAAAMMSNGIWITNQMLVLGVFFDQLTGKHGRVIQVSTGIYYTLCTIAGSLLGHYWSMKTEHGLGRVGAYATDVTPQDA